VGHRLAAVPHAHLSWDECSAAMKMRHENTNAAFDFIQKMSGVRSPSAFISTEHARKQLASLNEQAKQLATLAQKASLATAEPLKTASKPSG
jgi:hypothetical protein